MKEGRVNLKTYLDIGSKLFSVCVICAGGGAGGLWPCVDKYGQGIKPR